MKEQLLELLKVKSILSILFSLTTCVLAIKGILGIETFMTVTMSIITYYFTRRCKENGNTDNLEVNHYDNQV